MNMLDKLARLEGEVHRYKSTLDCIANVVHGSKDWDSPETMAWITSLLEDAGYDMGCIHSEPEDLIHGDSDGGAKG